MSLKSIVNDFKKLEIQNYIDMFFDRNSASDLVDMYNYDYASFEDIVAKVESSDSLSEDEIMSDMYVYLTEHMRDEHDIPKLLREMIEIGGSLDTFSDLFRRSTGIKLSDYEYAMNVVSDPAYKDSAISVIATTLAIDGNIGKFSIVESIVYNACNAIAKMIVSA